MHVWTVLRFARLYLLSWRYSPAISLQTSWIELVVKRKFPVSRGSGSGLEKWTHVHVCVVQLLSIYTELAPQRRCRFSTFSISRATGPVARPATANKEFICRWRPPPASHVPNTRVPLPPLSGRRPPVPSVATAGHLPITDAIGRDVCRNKFALNVRPGCRRASRSGGYISQRAPDTWSMTSYRTTTMTSLITSAQLTPVNLL